MGPWGIRKPCEDARGIVHNIVRETDIFVLDANYIQYGG